MSVLTSKSVQDEDLHGDEDMRFLESNRPHGKVVFVSAWSEVVAYNISCQDNGSSGLETFY